MEKPELIENAGVLSGLPGSPFTDQQVKVGANRIREVAGWHIAPLWTQEIILDHDGASVVRLPSLHVVDVLEVTDLSGYSERPVTGYRVSKSGMLSGRFPTGFSVLRVIFSHGYEKCPEALFPVIASAAVNGKMRSRQAGPFQESYEATRETDPLSESSVFARYQLGPRP